MGENAGDENAIQTWASPRFDLTLTGMSRPWRSVGSAERRVATRANAGWLAPALVVALLSGACAGADPLETGTTQQAVLDGYVDDATSGVVGLGVSLRRNVFAGHCTGALIAPNLVLTARHCVTEIGFDDPSDIVCGEADFNATREATELSVSPNTERPASPTDPSFVQGRRVFVAPGGRDICGFDVALIELQRSFSPSEATPLIPRIDQQAHASELFSAAGYGLTGVSPASSSGTRMRTDERSIICTGESCNALAAAPIATEGEWLSNDANICQGDSGGPALDDEGRVIGVASRGPADCAAAVYGDVAAWGEFIIDVALQAAESGGYEPPFWTNGSSDAPEQASELAVEDMRLDDAEAVDVEPVQEEEEVVEVADTSSEQEEPAALAAESACSVQAGPAGTGGVGTWVGLLLAVGGFWRRRRR